MAQPLTEPIGFISDIHGNVRALREVLAIFKSRDVAHVFAAGDHLLGGDSPLATWRELQRVQATLTQGLADRALIEISPTSLVPSNEDERARLANFERTRREIGDLVISQLRHLEERVRIPLVDGREILMVHGSPIDFTTEISDDLSDEEIEALLDDETADIVVCGSTHVPFQRAIGDVHVVNVGSVGAAPESGIAHFTIITPKMTGPQILQDWVRYEYDIGA